MGEIPKNNGKSVALDVFATLIDVQVMHCTTFQFKSVITNNVNQSVLFAVQNLRKRGHYLFLCLMHVCSTNDLINYFIHIFAQAFHLMMDTALFVQYGDHI